jgi:hypothetical protein
MNNLFLIVISVIRMPKTSSYCVSLLVNEGKLHVQNVTLPLQHYFDNHVHCIQAYMEARTNHQI